MSQWQPIETAPRDGTVIIVYRPDAAPHHQVGTDNWMGKRSGAWFGSAPGEQPTHWQPLPKPPRREPEAA